MDFQEKIVKYANHLLLYKMGNVWRTLVYQILVLMMELVLLFIKNLLVNVKMDIQD